MKCRASEFLGFNNIDMVRILKAGSGMRPTCFQASLKIYFCKEELRDCLVAVRAGLRSAQPVALEDHDRIPQTMVGVPSEERNGMRLLPLAARQSRSSS